MTHTELHEKIAAYLASLPQGRTVTNFSWSARYIQPRKQDGIMQDAVVLGSLVARTWLEAACLIARENLRNNPEDRFTEVLLRRESKVILVWDMRRDMEHIFDNEQIQAMDGPEVLKFSRKLG